MKKQEKNSKRLTIPITPTTLDRLNHRADQMGVKTTVLVRMIINEFLSIPNIITGNRFIFKRGK